MSLRAGVTIGSWLYLCPFTSAYPRQVSAVSSTPGKMWLTYHRVADNLNQMEVVDPQLPLPTAASFRVTGGGIGEPP
jgi:hypothetical protein